MRKTRIDIQLLLILLIISLIFVVFLTGKKTLNWNENYRIGSKDPYNLYVFSELLKDYFPKNNFKIIKRSLIKELPEDNKRKGLYVFIGKDFNVRMNEISNLLSFVSKGNNAFISAEVLPVSFLEGISSNFSKEIYFSFLQRQSISTNFTHQCLQKSPPYIFTYYNGPKPIDRTWFFINSENLYLKSYVILSYYNCNGGSYTNFIKIPYVKGFIYIHTTPVLFTNFFIKEPDGIEYCSKIFSNFSASDIYFDSGIYVKDEIQNAESNPLSFILSQKSLLWAWYILLSSIIIYVLIFLKRKQRTVPVINDLKNTSISFVEHVGKLYYLHDSLKNISNLKMRLFLFYIRNRFKIDASIINNDILNSISLRSGVSIDEIKNIFNLYNEIQSKPEKNKLKEFHKSIINFYKKPKSHGRNQSE